MVLNFLRPASLGDAQTTSNGTSCADLGWQRGAEIFFEDLP